MITLSIVPFPGTLLSILPDYYMDIFREGYYLETNQIIWFGHQSIYIDKLCYIK